MSVVFSRGIEAIRHIRMKRQLLSFFILFVNIGVVFTVSPARAQGGAATRQLGTNLDAVTDYSPQLPFTDLFVISRDWFTQCQQGVDPGCTSANAWDTGEAAQLDVDPQGWVRSLPAQGAAPVYTSVATYWDLPKEFPSGRYIVLYEGRGTLQYGLGATKLPELSTLGRDVVSVDISKGGILLRISETDTLGDGDYVRSVRFVAERDEARLLTNRFSSSFLERLRPYQVLRFMDWMRTNGSDVATWSSRPLSTSARFSTEKGVPAEIMVELANVSEKAPWFNMPHQASDDFIAQFATVVRDNLLPSLPVYVEYSNEVWNSAFAQAGWVEARGVAEWPGSLESGFTKRINWYGKRSAEVCEIWRSVFGASPERVVCVMASQAANSWTAREALSCPLWNEAPCAGHGINALAIAPYMGDYLGQEENAHVVAGWGASAAGLAKLFSELSTGGELAGGPRGGAIAESFRWIEANKEVATSFGLSLVSYEGGQHLVGIGSASNNESITSLFTSGNRDERMESLYTSYLQGWEARGGGLFMHYTDIGSYSKYGSWGALETIGQVASPKYNALWRYALNTDPPTAAPQPPSEGSRTVKVSKQGRGEVRSAPSGIRCGSRCRTTFSSAKRVALTAYPSAGYRFVRWKGACSHTRRTCSVSLPTAYSVTGVFARLKRGKGKIQ
jgi:Divergent InlB B-repeat domain